MKRETKAKTGVLLCLLVGICWPFGAAFGIDPGLLNGRWFKAKGSMKGYGIDTANHLVVESVAGTTPLYLKMDYQSDGDHGYYTITTCAPDPDNPGIWHLQTSGPISTDQIYPGNPNPLIWDLRGTAIPIYDGYSQIQIHGAMVMNITTEGAALKKATIKSLICGLWGESEDGGIMVGSCKLSGSSISPDKVPYGCMGD